MAGIKKLKVLDLFSGIGGFSLGLERTGGFETIAFCEIEEFPQKVLKKHWPDVKIYEDVKNITADMAANLLYIEPDGSVNCIGEKMPVKRSGKYNDAVSLYERGMSIQECADFYGITRQAMHKILGRRGCQFRPQLKYAEENHFNRGGETAGRKRAGHILEQAIKKGVVIQKNECEKCHATKTFSDGRSGIQAHHADYNKPLDVEWLCQKCHHEWHKHNKPKGIEEPGNATVDVVTAGFP